jgi:hypothetical protein
MLAIQPGGLGGRQKELTSTISYVETQGEHQGQPWYIAPNTHTTAAKYSLCVGTTIRHGQKTRDVMSNVGFASHTPLVVKLVATDKGKQMINS